MHAEHPRREIDLATWKRARHYALFSGREYPFAGVTADLDISAWDAERRRSGRKFFPAFLQTVMLAMNAIENFRYRIDGDKVVLFERIDPAFTVFAPEDELFYFAAVDTTAHAAVFDQSVEEASRKALETRCLEGGGRLDFVYISCLPWFRFTDITQPMRLGQADSIPRVVWGQYTRHGESVSVPFSIIGHHGLFDGLHIARLFAAIQGQVWNGVSGFCGK